MDEKEKGIQKLWYLRQEQGTRGPFPSGAIRRFLLLGRASLADQISKDQVSWCPVGEVPDVIPPDIRRAAEAGQLDVMHPARLREDERDGRERRDGDRKDRPNRRSTDQRRRPEPPKLQQRRASRAKLRDLRKRTSRMPLPAILVGASLVSLVIGYGVYIGSPEPDADPDCTAPPGSGVDWRNCHMSGLQAENSDLRGARLLNANLSGARLTGSRFDYADLRYADLTGADASYSEFGGARMKGSALRAADLSYANLSRADLSFADLAGANLGGAVLDGTVLDHAIWTDGAACQPGSRGICIRDHDLR